MNREQIERILDYLSGIFFYSVAIRWVRKHFPDKFDVTSDYDRYNLINANIFWRGLYNEYKNKNLKNICIVGEVNTVKDAIKQIIKIKYNERNRKI